MIDKPTSPYVAQMEPHPVEGTPIVDTINDSTLGQLRFDTTREYYVGTLSTLHGVVSFSFHLDGELLDAALKNARQVVEKMEALLPAVVDKLTSEFLVLKNDTWLEEDENEVSEQEFRSRARLSSITILGGGMTKFCFDDDDMFGGHALVVTVDSDGEIWDPELFG